MVKALVKFGFRVCAFGLRLRNKDQEFGNKDQDKDQDKDQEGRLTPTPIPYTRKDTKRTG